MEFRRYDDANDFYKRAERFLTGHEAEHNLLLGICAGVIAHPPTSNHIYQAIGYQPVCDVDEYRFL